MGNRKIIQTLRFVKRMITSPRASYGVAVTMLSSLGNLSLSIATARSSSIQMLGQFAIGFSIYVIGVGIVRSAVVEPTLASQPTVEDFRNSMRRASFLAVWFSAVVLGVGLILGMIYVVLIGIALHGCAAYEYAKVMNLSMFRPLNGLRQEFTWFFASLISSLLVLTGVISPVAGFAIWAFSCATIGYTTAFLLHLRCQPRWDKDLISNRVSAAFGLDFMIGTGSSQLALNAVSVTAGVSILGSLKAGGTLLGPVGMVVSTARSLLIPYLSRMILGRTLDAIRGAVITSGVMCMLALPFLALVSILPNRIGVLVLGANWVYARPLLPFLAAEMFFAVATTVPFAGHRALLAAKSTLIIRSLLAVLRILVIVLAAMAFGAKGAAGAMAGVAFVGAIVWWWSYALMLQKGSLGE